MTKIKNSTISSGKIKHLSRRGVKKLLTKRNDAEFQIGLSQID